MKYKFGIILMISAFVMSFGYTQTLKFVPPGTVDVGDSFFYDISETTNGFWKDYLKLLKKSEGEESEVYKNALLDTTVWAVEEGYRKPFVASYFAHPSYLDYPLVGVSHQQAINYCEWRTKAVKKMLEENDLKGPADFEYRLPTKAEWESMANAGFDKKSKKFYKKKLADLKSLGSAMTKVATAQMKYKERDELNPEEGNKIYQTPTPVKSFLPNKYGVFNINGNVAEMVAEPGIAMGGSFDHFYEDIVPENKAIKYDGPQKWLGFRCVCEVIEK